MTLSELYTKLATTNIPVAYEAFPEKQALPCITYNVAYSDNFGADDKVFSKFSYVDIFLYTATKDTETEGILETVLDSIPLFYNKTETYLDGEKAFQINYEVKING